MKPDVFSSEYKEDAWIAANLGAALPKVGFYVDVGCALPDHGSNTHFLRERGWRGLAIDAHPGYAQFWKSNFVQAVISPHAIVPFKYSQTSTMSRVDSGDGCTLVATARLDNLLRSLGVKKVDFLTVDAEGHEYDIFQTFDVEEFRPSVIVAEYDTLGIGKDMRVLELLQHGGKYRAVHQTEANIIYLRKPDEI